MSKGNALAPIRCNHAQIGLTDKGRAINELIVFNDLDQEPLDLLNGLVLGP